jgi:hypothetical protein
LRGVGGISGLGKSRQEYRDEHRDDADDDEQFDESKRRLPAVIQALKTRR